MSELYSSAAFERAYTYTGKDLGAVYTLQKTALRVWAPTAEKCYVNLYSDGDPLLQPKPICRIPMQSDVCGTWIGELVGDHNGIYYTYTAVLDGKEVEACDPYARTTGVNGHRAMILDLAATDPEGWEEDSDPHAGNAFPDAVIYELHLRDLSSDPNSGIRNVGKYLGLTETGTKTPSGIPTGLDHIKELGVTHIHLLPVYDFGSVDERDPGKKPFNWGYDPVNFNAPEGSYATDARNGAVRVAEFKQMVKALHDNGLSVILDVVYNHVYETDAFCFNKLVPGYFSRPGSNASGCGNDTASERSMVSKFIVDSVKYWAEEYHIDGFRFDLVGLIDTDTINSLIRQVRKTCPNVLFYGEGWSMDTKVTKPGYWMTTQQNAAMVPEFAFFNDTLRDLLRGSVFNNTTKGFLSGQPGLETLLSRCIMGNAPWCPNPTQTINYASCHDNNTLFDRILLATPNASREDQIRMNNLAAAICLTSQGIPFFQAGEELLRSKPLPEGGFDHNSYASPDSINGIRWADLEEPAYRQTARYYRGLIALRKAHSVLRLTSAEAVQKHMKPLRGTPDNTVAFQLKGETELCLIFNANPRDVRISLPEGQWDVCVNHRAAGTQALDTVSGTATVAPISALVLVRKV